MLTVHQTVSDVRGNFYQEKTVFLRCTVNSNPPARFIWKRGSDTLSHSQDNGVDIYEPLYTQVRTGSSWPGLIRALHSTLFLLHPTREGGRGLRPYHLEFLGPPWLKQYVLMPEACILIGLRTMGQTKLIQKAQGTVMGSGESPGQHVLLEHCQLGKTPPRVRQAISARCWLSW